MSTGAIIGIIIAVIVVAAVVVVASAQLRRSRTRRQFGPEYERLAQEIGPRKADAELTARRRRVDALGIHPLSAQQQASYSGDWAVLQERFVDAPADAVTSADALIWEVMRDRGYPGDDKNASMEALTVYHASSLDGYRQTAGLRTETATTEELREAMIRYRAMFEDLTGLRNGPESPETDRVAEIRERSLENSEVTTGDRDLLDEERDLPAETSDQTANTPR